MIAAGAFVALRPDDDDDAASAPAAATTTTVTTPAATTTTPAATTPAPKPKPKAVVIRTAQGAPLAGVRKVEVDKGDTVRIDVTSDVAEEVHVHGYDREVAIPAGGRAKVRFPASIDGRFEIELHGSGAQIGELTVNP